VSLRKKGGASTGGATNGKLSGSRDGGGGVKSENLR